MLLYYALEHVAFLSVNLIFCGLSVHEYTQFYEATSSLAGPFHLDNPQSRLLTSRVGSHNPVNGEESVNYWFCEMGLAVCS